MDPFSEAVKAASIGDNVGPVESEFGFHIIQVRAREERERGEAALERAKNQAFEEWLEEQRNEKDITVHDIWSDYIPQQ